ncbi:polysaccharide deacetylase [Pseudoroseomonas wenyumeiae]|uniref:Chitooligosaccharide deacetylase n=1 Tax=Teichococcus wenyumeiae TaxID=2478470 RepID=A0A3A9JN42_9PROT|nr:polysaccharide deacetylase [Pseudoroseomonas wenyumeiae]RKK06173.1 polysaccharide deacetylase [Pseudoroseomonas wenyumeiae]RMI17514.1 polysaccharide deacetylase [Pseudoroseomonas wenyumeiae]
MPRHIACLSYDFDTWSGFASRGMLTPTPISRGEFGVIGARRILDLLSSRGIKGSWYIPGVVIKTYPEACESVVAGGHEVGHHGWSHIPPAELSADREAEEFAMGVEAIRGLTGQIPAGYRSPAWDLSEQSIDLMVQHGLRYDSSMMGHDCEPYFARRGDKVAADAPLVFGETTDLVEVPISWSLDDHPHFEFFRTKAGVMPGLANAGSVLENWLADFEYMRRTTDWGVLVYTFHPYVSGRGHRMMMMEKLIDALTAMGAEFCTLDEVQREFRARQAS